MKILFINTGFYDLGKTNANTVCLKKILEQLKKKNKCYVLTNNRRTNKIEVYKDSGIEIHCVPEVVQNKINRIFFKKWVSDAYKYYDEKLKNKDFDVVISISNKFETILIGEKIKKASPNIYWSIYELDPYAFSPHNNFCKRLIKSKIEEKAFEKANSIFLTTELYDQYTNNRYKKFSKKYIDLGIPMLENLNNLNVKSETDNFYNFIYVGSFYKKIRNPQKMLEIFHSITNKNKNIKLHLYSSGCDKIIDYYKEIFTKENLIIHTHKTNEEILNILGKGDFLINIGNKNSNQVPSKIFEYMSIGKPIINFVQIDDDSSVKYLEKYNNSINIDYRGDIKEQIKLLEEFIERNYNEKVLFEDMDVEILKYSINPLSKTIQNTIEN